MGGHQNDRKVQEAEILLDDKYQHQEASLVEE